MNQLTVSPTALPPVNPDRTVIDTLRHSSVSWLEEQLTSDWDFVGYSITGKQTMDELMKAHKEISNLCPMIEETEVARELIKLKTLTIPRNESGGEYDMTLEAYTEQLKGYPADAVLEVLKAAPGKNKFFPAWYELKEELDYKSSHRLAALKAIEEKINARRLTEIRSGKQSST